MAKGCLNQDFQDFQDFQDSYKISPSLAWKNVKILRIMKIHENPYSDRCIIQMDEKKS